MDNSISINKTNRIYFRFPVQNNGNDFKLSSSENAMQLSGYNVGGAIFARNNITFRNLATPIGVTDKYNKKIEGKDHLDLPNIHVYEYPDTNLQVFICENDNSNDEKDRILMKFNIHNNIDDKDDFIKKELCTRLFCNLINYDNDDCFVTTFDSDFFSVNYNLTNKNYKRIREINKLITNPDFSETNLEQVKTELIKELDAAQIKSSKYDSVIQEISNTDINDINKYYLNKLKNAEAQLFVVIDKDNIKQNRTIFDKEFNTNISKKFVKHKNDNSNNFTVNDKQFIFSAPENDVFLEFQYPMPMNDLRNIKLGEYLTQLMLLYRMPYVSQNSFPVKYKLDSELRAELENKPLNSYLRFKITPNGNEKINNTAQAIDAFEGMLLTLCENDLAAETLEHLKELDKQNIKNKLLHRADIYEKNLLLKETNYVIFKLYEVIDSITINDIKQTIINYMLKQKPYIYVNKNKNPYTTEMKND